MRFQLRRPGEASDVEAYHRWFADPRVTEFLPQGLLGPMRIEDVRIYLARMAREERPELFLMVEEQDAGNPVGCVSFRNFDSGETKAELSLVIGEPALWGRGAGRQALELLIQYGRECLGLTRLVLSVRENHERAIRLYQRAGFELEERHEGGYLRPDGSRFARLVMRLGLAGDRE